MGLHYTEVDVFIGSNTIIDEHIYTCWLDGYTPQETAILVKEKECIVLRGIHDDLIISDVLDQYRLFGLIERLLQSPSMIGQGWSLQINAKTRRLLIEKYYEFDDCVVREILGKKLSSRNRTELKDVSEKTSVGLKSCRRQFDNVKRVYKAVEDMGGNLIFNIQNNFLLSVNMLVNSVSIKIGYLLLISFNGYLVNGEKGGANIVIQGKSEGSGGGQVIVNAPKKGPQNIVVRDYGGTVVLNSHKKGGANIVINSHGEKKPHHSHHHAPHHHHALHDYESPKMMPMLGEAGSSSSAIPAFGTRTVKPYDSEEVAEEPTPAVTRKRKGNKSRKLKKKAKVVQEQSESEEVVRPKIRGRSKGDSESETETGSEDDSQSDAYSPSVAEEDPYANYRDGPGPIPQSDRKGLRELEKGVEYGVEAQVEQQIEEQIAQGLLGQLPDDESSDSGSPASSSGSSGSSPGSSSGSSSGDTFGFAGDSGSDSGSDSPGYFASSFPSSDPFNSDALKGLSLSDALFGSDKDSGSSDSGLMDLPWSRK